MDFVGAEGAQSTATTKLIPHGGTVTGTSEVVVAQVKVKGGVWSVGSTIFFRCTDHNTTTNSAVTYRLRIGSAGTTSDAAVQQFNTTPSIQTTTTTEGTSVITATGASATHIGNATYLNAAGNAGHSGNTSATSSFNSANDMWVSLTAQNSTSVTRTIRGGFITIFHP